MTEMNGTWPVKKCSLIAKIIKHILNGRLQMQLTVINIKINNRTNKITLAAT